MNVEWQQAPQLQNQTLASYPECSTRMMTGAMRSTLISAMEDRQEIKILTQPAKFKRLQGHPMNERVNHPTRGRLKRSNFLQHSRILKRRNSELLGHMPKPIPAVKTIPSWKRGQLPRVCIKVPGVADRGCQSEPERKSLTLEYVNIKYPEDQWTHVYTDGSAARSHPRWGRRRLHQVQ